MMEAGFAGSSVAKKARIFTAGGLVIESSLFGQYIEQINETTSCQLPLSPAVTLLNLIKEGSINKPTLYLIATLFSVARTTIAAFWKTLHVPTTEDWQGLWENFVIGKLVGRMASSVHANYKQQFVAIWFPLIGYMAEHDIVPNNPIYQNMLYF